MFVKVVFSDKADNSAEWLLNTWWLDFVFVVFVVIRIVNNNSSIWFGDRFFFSINKIRL